MFKISDFKLAKFFIKKACSFADCAFVDLQIEFSETNEPVLKNGVLDVGMPEILGDTQSRIISLYLNNFHDITGCNLPNTDIEKVLICINNFFRFLCFHDNSYKSAKPDEGIAMRLYQIPFVWLLIKDIVGPAFCIDPVNNCKVIVTPSPFIDCALYVDETEDKELYEKIEEPFILLNSDIEYKPYAYAHLFVEAIKANNRCPFNIVSTILDSSLKNKIIGLAKLAFKSDKEVNDFMLCLMTISEYKNNCEELMSQICDKNIKVAQMGMNPYMNISDTWWFLGIIEKMLEPARGPDWSTYEGLKPYTEEVWDKINKERERRGRAGMTYEALLRFKDGENDPDKVRVIEKALSSDRVW